MRNLEPTNTSQIARVADGSVSLVHWGLTRMTRYISISVYLCISTVVNLPYKFTKQFAWRIHATFGPLCWPPNLFFHILGWEIQGVLLAFLIGKIQVGDPGCNIYIFILRFPPGFSHLPCIFSMGKVGFAPRDCPSPAVGQMEAAMSTASFPRDCT